MAGLLGTSFAHRPVSVSWWIPQTLMDKGPHGDGLQVWPPGSHVHVNCSCFWKCPPGAGVGNSKHVPCTLSWPYLCSHRPASLIGDVDPGEAHSQVNKGGDRPGQGVVHHGHASLSFRVYTQRTGITCCHRAHPTHLGAVATWETEAGDPWPCRAARAAEYGDQWAHVLLYPAGRILCSRLFSSPQAGEGRREHPMSLWTARVPVLLTHHSLIAPLD